MTCLGVFRIGEIRGNGNKTGLKKGGVIEIKTTVLPFANYSAFHYAMHALFRF